MTRLSILFLKMLVDGAIIIAVYEEEEGGCFLERSPQDILVAPITKKEAKHHARSDLHPPPSGQTNQIFRS